MTYNLSPKVVERMQEPLNRLLAGQETVFSSDAPHKLAYALREAIAAAKRNKLDPYDKLEYTFVVGHGKLTAKPRESLVTSMEVPPQVVDSAISDFDVVASASRSKANELHFPNFNGDIAPVNVWAERKGFTVTTDPFLKLVRNAK